MVRGDVVDPHEAAAGALLGRVDTLRGASVVQFETAPSKCQIEVRPALLPGDGEAQRPPEREGPVRVESRQ
ncbi:hypothetical protein Aca07nite_73230 [Actinoplanes capillaceus]|uniref:Uncharacterized protein n=1 Tax=Actinoplanes campanulatus TaxID=113559 RepID=A0ABQ3WV37_9ACTN|nr:hypothetical protein Aca07nite_73230 [Actinoplanes capillaceus]